MPPNKTKHRDAAKPHIRGDHSFLLPTYATIPAQQKPMAPRAQRTPQS
jgi:hypothetical protein